MGRGAQWHENGLQMSFVIALTNTATTRTLKTPSEEPSLKGQRRGFS